MREEGMIDWMIDRLTERQQAHLQRVVEEADQCWLDGRVMAALCRKGLVHRQGTGKWIPSWGVEGAWRRWEGKKHDRTGDVGGYRADDSGLPVVGVEMSGYFEVGIFQPKTPENVGLLFRSAYQLGAAGVFVVGELYKRAPTDVYNTGANIPLRRFVTIQNLRAFMPDGCKLVGIEMGGKELKDFSHPRQAVYLLGSEDGGLSKETQEICDAVVSLPAVRRLSYNVAVAGSIVMYDRIFRAGWEEG